jgi:hypothetical protein
MNGASQKSFAASNEGCFVAPWLIPSSTTPTLNVQLHEFSLKLPLHLLAPCPKEFRGAVPTEIPVRVPMLVPASGVVGKTNVVLTQPEHNEEVLQGALKQDPIEKSLGPQPVLAGFKDAAAASSGASAGSSRVSKSDVSAAHLLK